MEIKNLGGPEGVAKFLDTLASEIVVLKNQFNNTTGAAYDRTMQKLSVSEAYYEGLTDALKLNGITCIRIGNKHTIKEKKAC